MRSIFVFTASNPQAQINIGRSIARPVDPSIVLGQTPHSHLTEINRIFLQSVGFYLWGAVPGPRNIPNWESMRAGDWVLAVWEGHYHYAAKVVAKFHWRDLAVALWGREDGTGLTWEYLYFLTRPESTTAVSCERLGLYLNRSYRGFARIGDQKMALIQRTFGSVDKFIESVLLVR